MQFRFEYTGIRVTDLAAALRFFTEGLGLTVLERSDVPETGGKLVTLQAEPGGPRLELNWYPHGSPYATRYAPGEALDHLAFSVRGGTLREAIARLERAGGKLTIEPFREGTVTLAFVESPDGHAIELYEKA